VRGRWPPRAGPEAARAARGGGERDAGLRGKREGVSRAGLLAPGELGQSGEEGKWVGSGVRGKGLGRAGRELGLGFWEVGWKTGLGLKHGLGWETEFWAGLG